MWRERLFTGFLSLIALALAAAIGLYLWSLGAVNAPGQLRQPTTVIIKPGTGLGAIARQLEQAKVISNDLLFQWQARQIDGGRSLKPGEYKFDPGLSISAVIEKLISRDVVARFVTIPEGLVTAEIAALLTAAEGLEGEAPLDVPDGALLPETYRYEWGDSRPGVIDRMKKMRAEALDELWAKRAPDLPLASPEEALVLASIVEKETGIAAERGKVAGVFINRLRKNMRLQSDPTVIYGLKPGGLGRELTRADLESETPFNTYVIDRLPPAPICHPGRAAIAAVLNPETTDALYFVADGTGGHAFAATLAEHDKNVARWRKLDVPTAEPPTKDKAPAKKTAKSPPKPAVKPLPKPRG
ncbi:MAG: endolytic transglycosylase MltG [Rhodospirillaceae bacterium]|nr:endolytic transglycosylase MltG [Rhodospirillaceae bacterium]